METYLQVSESIDWHHPAVLELARVLAIGQAGVIAIARACFEWVRDEIHHSVDYQMNPVTCRASDVLHHRTGFCFAKSHLLAALLRANAISTGFCYQRLSIHDDGEPYSLHGFNASHLPDIGRYRLDPRGNHPGINAQFNPPVEQLAYTPQLPGEVNLPGIFPEPLPIVLQALQTHTTWDAVLNNLPDLSLVSPSLVSVVEA